MASGGIRRSGVYNGVFLTNFEFDSDKLAGWQNWSAQVETETRFGGLFTGTGAINPVNTAAIIPGTNGTVSAVTALNVTKLFPLDPKEENLIAVSRQDGLIGGTVR